VSSDDRYWNRDELYKKVWSVAIGNYYATAWE